MRLLNEFYDLLKESVNIWSKKNPYLIGGSIAFYVIFSTAPLFVIILLISGIIYGRSAAEGQIVSEFSKIVGRDAALIIQDIIAKASSPPKRLITLIISVPMVLLGSSMIFYQIRHALNILWDIKEEDGIKEMAKDYFLSFIMVIIAGGVVFLLVLKMPALYLLRDYLEEVLSFPGKYIRIIDGIFTFLVLVILVAMIYKVLPRADIEWKDVWVGSLLTSFLFTVAVILINLYVSSTGVDSAYGAVGAGTILLIWIYYSSLVFLLGAAFTKVYASRYGSERDWDTEKSH